MKPRYTELQVASNFSFLRGASHPEELVETAKALGHDAIAITDRNSFAGIVRGHVAAKKAGLDYIVGCRLDLVAGTRTVTGPVTGAINGTVTGAITGGPTGAPAAKPTDFEANFRHDLTGPHAYLCYPTDRAAYGRLSRLLSEGKLGDTPKGECHLTFADMLRHRYGQLFIALPPEEWLDPCRPVQEAAALLAQAAGQLQPAPLLLAASYTYQGNDRARIARLAEIAAQAGVRLVATGDVHYHTPTRRPLQDVLTAIREHTTVHKAGFLLAANAERYLKAPDEMARLFAGYEDALAATLWIKERARMSLEELRYNYPDEPIPPGSTPQEHLEMLTWEGAALRYPDGVPDKVRIVLSKELVLIKKLKYAPYFLTVHDIVHWARSQNILCQGRGSAANSAVCYCLYITAINPMDIDLLFERFMSEERKEPPDIDVDFEHERREEVMQYIYARYGRERAGITATVISYRSRSAVREVAKAMGLSEDVQSALASSVWGWSDKGVPEKRAAEAGLDPNDPLIAKTLALTRTLVGFPRHLSQHVGGFVLTQDPLVEVVPVGNAAMDHRTFIEWDKDDLDALGILKIDVLALGMLTCVRKSLEFMATEHSDKRDLASFFPADDQATFDMLCEADSLGVFQVESRAQMNMLPRLKPRCFYDLVIEVAIVRPGPIQGDMVHPYLRRRDGLEPVVYPSPAPEFGPPDELARILKKTMGVPLFQEQAMKIAIDAAKFSPDEANELRHAMATFRRRGTIDKLQAKMVGRMVERGYDPDFAERCFNQVKGFGEYGFPESHSASFALLVYVSSWIKCHYPGVFCAALLNSQPLGFYAPAQIVRDARAHGVEVRPVDVNSSHWDSTLEASRSSHKQRAVRLGFRQVKGFSEADCKALVALRERLHAVSTTGQIPSIEAIYLQGGVSVAGLEKLAAADAFRSLGLDRRAALWAIKALPDTKGLPLFTLADASDRGEDADIQLPEMKLGEHVVDDYQTLRLSLKAHPLSFLRADFGRRRVRPADDLRSTRDGSWISIVGLVIVRQRPGTASGVIFMTLEDETGIVNAIVWPKVMEKYRSVVMGSRLIMARGRIQRAGDIIHLVVNHLEDWSFELLKLSDGSADLVGALARADEVARPVADPRVPEPLADPDRVVKATAPDTINAFRPAPADRPGATKPLRTNRPIAQKPKPSDTKPAAEPKPKPQLEPFSYGMHPRSVRNLIPKSRDFR